MIMVMLGGCCSYGAQLAWELSLMASIQALRIISAPLASTLYYDLVPI